MPGESLSIKIYIRNACSGSGKNAGTARVWFDDSSADSRLLKIGTSAATGPARDAARADVESREVQWTPRHGREAFSGERRLPMTTGPPEAHGYVRPPTSMPLTMPLRPPPHPRPPPPAPPPPPPPPP